MAEIYEIADGCFEAANESEGQPQVADSEMLKEIEAALDAAPVIPAESLPDKNADNGWAVMVETHAEAPDAAWATWAIEHDKVIAEGIARVQAGSRVVRYYSAEWLEMVRER